jgi:hypothetical protein
MRDFIDAVESVSMSCNLTEKVSVLMALAPAFMIVGCSEKTAATR